MTGTATGRGKSAAGGKAPEKATAAGPDETASNDASADASATDPTEGAVLTQTQPRTGVSEVLTGTPERPESTRIVPGTQAPASGEGVDLRPAEYRDEPQVAPTEVPDEVAANVALHGNADY